jgi:hypothetical protein
MHYAMVSMLLSQRADYVGKSQENTMSPILLRNYLSNVARVIRKCAREYRRITYINQQVSDSDRTVTDEFNIYSQSCRIGVNTIATNMDRMYR